MAFIHFVWIFLCVSELCGVGSIKCLECWSGALKRVAELRQSSVNSAEETLFFLLYAVGSLFHHDARERVALQKKTSGIRIAITV